LAAFASIAVIQLARGKPLRGGVDVGTGIETADQLFGASVVKAYELESEVAQYPRIVVGSTLREYLDALSLQPADNPDPLARYEIVQAKRALRLLTLDEDGQWILDSLGDGFREDLGANLPVGVVHDAHQFVRESVRKWQRHEKLGPRYKWLARYFSKRATRWQWNPADLPLGKRSGGQGE
jgi:hypothetical protein